MQLVISRMLWRQRREEVKRQSNVSTAATTGLRQTEVIFVRHPYLVHPLAAALPSGAQHSARFVVQAMWSSE